MSLSILSFSLGITTLVMLILDFVYLFLNKDLFQKQIQKIQKKKLSMKWIPAVLCYISLVFLLYYFILLPKRPLHDAFLLGLAVYLVYETTNMSLFDQWQWKTVLLDSVWGGILFTLTTLIVRTILSFSFTFHKA